jgi:hypothetical protein
MIRKPSDQKTVCNLMAKIISRVGHVYDSACKDREVCVNSSLDEIREQLDALETVLRRIIRENAKIEKETTVAKGGAE